MNWGYKITFAAILFMGYIVFLVIKCFQQDVTLVDKYYYKEEIEYQAKINKIANANKSEGLAIHYLPATDNLSLQFDLKDGAKYKGNVQFFRPSNDKMDKVFALAIDNSGRQLIPTTHLVKGLWKVKVSWSDGQAEYYKEEVLVL